MNEKVDVVIADRVQRHPGYRCEPFNHGFLIGPLGTADCPEVETLRSCLLDQVEPEPAASAEAPSAFIGRASQRPLS